MMPYVVVGFIVFFVVLIVLVICAVIPKIYVRYIETLYGSEKKEEKK